MPTLKQAFAEGHPRVQTYWEGHGVVIQEVGPVGYELWVDGQRITYWAEELRTRRELASGITLPSSERIAIPEDHAWMADASY